MVILFPVCCFFSIIIYFRMETDHGLLCIAIYGVLRIFRRIWSCEGEEQEQERYALSICESES